MTDCPQDIGLDAAIALLKESTPPFEKTESCPLPESFGRILAEDIISPINVPAQDTSAVDGYAFCYDDLSAGRLPVGGVIKAGHAFEGKAERGFAYRIFTGAGMPEGADTVAMQEHCNEDSSDGVLLPQGLVRGVNFRMAGENVAKGDTTLTKGVKMGSAEIGLAAAIGQTELKVARRLRIALLSMGDELTETGSKHGATAGMVYDSNRPMLRQMMAEEGHEVIDFGIINDDKDALTKAYGIAAKKADVILSSGGSSDGDEDYALDAIRGNDGVIDFWRLAIKPGRPMAAGRIGSTPIYCTPGNPVAAFVCVRLLVNPILAYLQGRDAKPPLRIYMRAGFCHRHRQGRTEFLRARLDLNDGDGKIVLHGRRGAGVLSSLRGADGLVEISGDYGDVKEGDFLPFILLRESGL